MKVVAMIPIKMNNQRLPGKNVKVFSDGTPLVELIQRACINASNVDEVYIYCSSEEIKPYVIDGVKFLKRPIQLDSDDVNCNDIIQEFMKEVDADIYVVSHATGPFTQSKSIDTCIGMLKTGKYDSAFLASCIQQFLWSEGQAINFDVQHFPRTQDLAPIYIEAPGAYVFQRETFNKYNRRVGVKPYIHCISEIEGRDIDNLEDFLIADAIYTSIIRPGIMGENNETR